jgi:bifunctional N-acetylglucosamine-1-phosphate-uridyltransferase/glucosamine-1-phosphate-acetyltransferase GlmU-like protein
MHFQAADHRSELLCEIVESKETQNTEREVSQVCVGVNKLKDRLSQEAIVKLSLEQ